MATPMPAISFVETTVPRPAPKANPECPPQTSTELIENQREKIEAEIQRANDIRLSLEEEQDADIYSQGTLDRASAFLMEHMNWCWNASGTLAPIPAIGPGPKGSVDLYWATTRRKLLVNIPASKDASATFYGDDNHRQTIKGSFDANDLSLAVIAWLMD
jgi:hypothetical protein